MQLLFRFIFSVVGFVALVSLLVGFISGLRLSPYDAELQRSRREPPGFRWLPKRWPAPRKEDFPEELRSLWVFRDRCFKTFVICGGLLAISAVAAVICGLDLPLK
ncbi:MAG TPA: hypothetical protein VHD32_09900 [Candidatus Didemnitutus sp.]|nr:hypothetical protein [Candidatus Didemnitutus sp.]